MKSLKYFHENSISTPSVPASKKGPQRGELNYNSTLVGHPTGHHQRSSATCHRQESAQIENVDEAIFCNGKFRASNLPSAWCLAMVRYPFSIVWNWLTLTLSKKSCVQDTCGTYTDLETASKLYLLHLATLHSYVLVSFMQRARKRPRLRNECVDWRFDIGPVHRDAGLSPQVARLGFSQLMNPRLPANHIVGYTPLKLIFCHWK